MSKQPQAKSQHMSPWLEPLQTEASYGRKASRSLAVLAIGQGGKLLLHVLGTMVLARLLLPADFGLIAMAATVISFLILFKDAGLTSATVQQKEITHTQVSTLFWLNVMVGSALALLTLASAPLLAYLYGEPVLIPMVAVLAAGFFLGSFGAQHDALMRRRMAFRQVAVSEVASLALGTAVAIALALAGAGIWALVAQRVVQMAGNAVFNWMFCNWRPGFHFRWAEARQQFAFGAHVSGFNFVNYFSRNGDNILIGWYWGAVSLGVYAKAYDLLLGPLSQISAPLHNMMQPLLGRLRDEPERYRRAYLKVMIPANLAMLPVATLMFVVPEHVVQILLGSGWQQAGGVVMWLGLAVATQIAGGSTGFVLISQKRSADYARIGVVNSIVTIVGFILTLPFGITAVAAGYVVVGLFLRMPIAFWYAGRVGPVSIKDLWSTLSLSLSAAAFMLPVMAITKIAVQGAQSFIVVPMVGMAGCLAMVIGLLAVKDGRKQLKLLWKDIRGLRR